MTRIVAGSAKGRTLKVPAKGTRPTSERVREALFARLDNWGLVDGAVVLDLYAGSGALGLEALSRGAAQADLVEKSRPAAALLAENVRSLGLPARVHVQDVRTFLASRGGAALLGGQCGLVLVDPPYDVGEDELAAVLEALGPWLTPDSLVAVERSTRSPEPTWPTHLKLEDRSTWGETAVWFAGPPLEATS
ncbi:16S rRNA (guanine(966)-N(2))-methyltransferase RsmD [Schaalia sp. 19OD2882]|uniref:16S rRNA (guanine(966)-N(2))-methyltransferase RsmD n=1 Tax=Schaalia sp. 19OD2882 TaxID=2794089 RepID=UPI001C1F06E6|nr:16S rRNA (guanine(966)-N(2))-methyltransferase RsmD [Schaalia sp. 19OD2882]QWW18908.1 16S rRNA (guanine(966)-N(2))-methyltransferase RsmD [Schaalia sp. 19OD2882]